MVTSQYLRHSTGPVRTDKIAAGRRKLRVSAHSLAPSKFHRFDGVDESAKTRRHVGRHAFGSLCSKFQLTLIGPL